MGKRGSGKRLSDRERIEIIECFEQDSDMTNSKCARQYGVSAAAISRLLKRSQEIKKRYLQGNLRERDHRRRGGIAKHAAFEDELLEWIMDLKEKNITVSSTLVQDKAKSISQKHNLGPFKASYGWYFRFCKRHGLIGRGAALGIEFQDGSREQSQEDYQPMSLLQRPELPVTYLSEMSSRNASPAFAANRDQEEPYVNVAAFRSIGAHEDLSRYPYHFAVCHSLGNIVRFMEIVEQIDREDGDINACVQVLLSDNHSKPKSASDLKVMNDIQTTEEMSQGNPKGSPKLVSNERSHPELVYVYLSAVQYASYLGYVEIVKYFLRREDVVKSEKKFITIQRAQKYEAQWMHVPKDEKLTHGNHAAGSVDGEEHAIPVKEETVLEGEYI